MFWQQWRHRPCWKSRLKALVILFPCHLITPSAMFVFFYQKMNGLSIRELCCLFCCPPCPSRIAAKLAFLPPEPTYALLPDPDPGSGAGTAAGSTSGAAVPSIGAPGLRSRLGTSGGSDRGGAGGGGGGGALGCYPGNDGFFHTGDDHGVPEPSQPPEHTHTQSVNRH